MKRALLLTYDYPPCTAPGAAVRSRKLAQYLPEFGWEAFVVCRDERLSANKAIDSTVSRIGTPIPPWLSYQLGAWAWAARIPAHVRALLGESRYDLLCASCPPFPHALAAIRLAREAGIPLVVDFRDAWSLDPHLGGGPVRKLAKRSFCRLLYPPLERRLIESASAVVLCTPSMHAAYAHLFAHAESRLHLVTNGFDEADYRDAPERPTRDRPLLLYCGRFSGIAERSPDLLLRALRTVVDAGREIQLEILGDNSEAVRRSIQRLGLRDFVRTHAPVPHAEAVRAMRMADILVVCQPPSRNGVSATAGKTYEYLRCGLPVLALVPEGDNADLVRRYAPVHAVVTTGDAGAAAAAILHLLDAVRGAPAPDPGFLENYNRRRIAERIAGIFDAALKTALRPPTP